MLIIIACAMHRHLKQQLNDFFFFHAFSLDVVAPFCPPMSYVRQYACTMCIPQSFVLTKFTGYMEVLRTFVKPAESREDGPKATNSKLPRHPRVEEEEEEAKSIRRGGEEGEEEMMKEMMKETTRRGREGGKRGREGEQRGRKGTADPNRG